MAQLDAGLRDSPRWSSRAASALKVTVIELAAWQAIAGTTPTPSPKPEPQDDRAQ